MFSALKEFLVSRILDMNSILLKEGYPNLDKKKLMSENGWKELPEKIQRPLFLREAFQQVANFVEHTPNYLEIPGTTQKQQLEYLAHDFMDRYEKWLDKNEGKYNVKEIIGAIKSKLDDRTPPPDDAMFESLTVILIHRYGIQVREEASPTPEPTEPEAA